MLTPSNHSPAVTLALIVMQKISPLKGILYIFFQAWGAVLGAALLWGATSNIAFVPLGAPPVVNMTMGNNNWTTVLTDVGNPPYGLGANAKAPNITVANAMLLEFMGTAVLLGTVFMTAVDSRSMKINSPLAAIPIGTSVFLAHLVLIPFTGCGINPARTFGPALVNAFAGVDKWGGAEGFAIYYVAPFAASIIVPLVVMILWGGINPPKDEE